MVARGGIEQSNHRHADFQSGEGDSRGLLINHLQRLPAPSPASPRHNYGTPNVSSTHSWHSRVRGPIANGPSVFPDVNRRAVHARRASSVLCSKAQCMLASTDKLVRVFRCFPRLRLQVHSPHRTTREIELGNDGIVANGSFRGTALPKFRAFEATS